MLHEEELRMLKLILRKVFVGSCVLAFAAFLLVADISDKSDSIFNEASACTIEEFNLCIGQCLEAHCGHLWGTAQQVACANYYYPQCAASCADACW